MDSRINTHFTHEIHAILSARRFAVAGASRNPDKYGFKVYKALKRAGYEVFAVNPNADEIEGDPVYPLLDNVPGTIDCVVTVVQPSITYEIVRRAGHLRIPHLWMQPGSESQSAIVEMQAQGIQGVYGGPCILVALAGRPQPPRAWDEDEAPAA